MNSSARIAAKYAAIAALATIANLVTQMLFVAAYAGPYAIEGSILAGTAVGLPIKYVLEKRHIFSFEADGILHDGRVFIAYTLMGVLTTCFFWGTEYLFHVLFDTDAMRYVGGALGLIIGYYVKYLLDKRYVFVRSAEPTGARQT